MAAPTTLMELAEAHASGSVAIADTIRALYEAVEIRGDDGIWISMLSLEDALAEAAHQAKRAEDGETLPLLGVPFAVKDNIDVAGLPTTAACPAFSYDPKQDASCVARLRKAGAIPVGKTNLDQFATGLSGTRTPYTIPHSVFSAEHISGGSSSGSAVAVGAGLVPFALGTDTAGSGRVPAAMNNIVGVKPSRGLVSAAGSVPACQSIDCIAIFAGTAAEGDFVRQIAQGFDPSDPFSRTMKTRALNIDAPTIAVPSPASREFHGDAEAADLFQAAIDALPDLGFKTVEIDYTPLGGIAQLLYGGPFVAERYAAVGEFADAHPDAMHPVVGEIVAGAKGWSAADLFKGIATVSAAKTKLDAMFDAFDALMLPTAPIAPTIQALLDDPIAVNSKLGTYTNFVNLLDCAAISVPAGFRPSLMPFGVTLVGPAFSDSDLAYLGDRLHRTLSGETGGARRPIEGNPASAPIPDGWVEVAVVGAHLKGLPLHTQLEDLNARFVREAQTADSYRFYALAGTTPKKPGLVFDKQGGGSITLEIYALSPDAFGKFTAAIPSPLGIGKIELTDGGTVSGFLCESRGLEGAEDITKFGGWRAYLKSLSN